MYENFINYFQPDDPMQQMQSSELGIAGFLERFGGASFRHGLYRVVRPLEQDAWRERILGPYPEFNARISCFGFDWMGNAFATDSSRLVENQPGVVMFEVGTGKALDIPSNLESFHEVGLKQFGEAVLAVSFYNAWINAGGAEPDYSHCVGYKKPLFLGGKDAVDNLEMSDIDVYWHILGQLIRRARGLA